MEAAGQDTSEAAAKISYWNKRQDDFLQQTGFKRQQSREEIAGFTWKDQKAASEQATDRYNEWAKSIGVKNSIEDLAKYYDIKYNDSPRYELLQKYVSSVKAGKLSPLAGFDLYEQYHARIESELVGIEVGGTTITGQTDHFLERVFGCMRDPKNGKPRDGTALEDVFDCIKNPIKIMPPVTKENGDVSFVVIGHRAMVSIDPYSGGLIQTNRWRG